jgi:hypothetical protein
MGERGERINIDILTGIIGVKDEVAKKLAIEITINEYKPVRVLHPVLVLESRCANLLALPRKRRGNGLTQAKVACQVVTKYLEACLADPARRRESLGAARRISELARRSEGVFVWTEWEIDVMQTVDPSKMPGQFVRSWATDLEKVERKRALALTRVPTKSP